MHAICTRVPGTNPSAGAERPNYSNMMQAKGHFRETLWFKLGDLGQQPSPPLDDDNAPSSLERPIEDRYLDDGTVTREDSTIFGIHTGQTQCLRPIYDIRFHSPEAELAVLVREMKRTPRSIVAGIGLSCIGVTALLLLQLV